MGWGAWCLRGVRCHSRADAGWSWLNHGATGAQEAVAKLKVDDHVTVSWSPPCMLPAAPGDSLFILPTLTGRLAHGAASAALHKGVCTMIISGERACIAGPCPSVRRGSGAATQDAASAADGPEEAS